MKVEFPGNPPGGGDGTPGGSSGQIQYNNAGSFGGVASTGTGDVVRASAPTMTDPVVGTQTQGDNSTKAASTAYVDTALAGVVQVLAGEVATFADLPAAASHSGENYLVRTSTGVYFVNRKVAGIYTSNGSVWALDGDATEAYFQDTLAWTNITSKPSTFPPVIGSGAGDAVAGNDSRLTNERVPTAAGLTTKFGTNKASIADGDKLAMLDSAASDVPVHILWSLVKSTLKTYFDTRYTTAAAALTAAAGIKLDDFAAPDDNTDLNASTSAHGLLPKLGGGSTNFLRADGTWAAPASGSGTDIFDFTKLDAVATFGGSTLACNVPYRGTAVGTGTLTTYAGSDFPAAEIRTGTTSGWGYYVAFWASSGTSNTFDLDETHTWTMMFWIRTGADIGNYRLLVGAVGTAGAAVPVAGIGVRFDTDASDTNFRLAAWDASTPTLGSDNLGAVAINTVYAIKIWCTGDGTVRATVNGGTQSTLTTGFTATRVTPLFQLINSTTADKRMQVARFAFHVEWLSP